MTSPPVTVVLEPKKRIRVRLPYAGGGANYDLLRDLCGLNRRGAVRYSDGEFSVARSDGRARDLIRGLVQRFGIVEVTQVGKKSVYCAEACWTASERTVEDCECGCAGANHASGEPAPYHLASTRTYTVRRDA